MPTIRLAALYVCLGTMPAASVAGVIRHDRNIDQYRQLGREPQFSSVGEHLLRGSRAGSAVLIAPQWVLSAAHILVTEEAPLTDHSWRFGGRNYGTKEVFFHPSFERNPVEAQLSGGDLALVELLNPAVGITPAARYRGVDEVGAHGFQIGYGLIGDGLNGITAGRERLGGTNVIDAAGGHFFGSDVSAAMLVADFDHPDDPSRSFVGSTMPLDLEIGITSGDSGGGLFAEFDSQWLLIGINEAKGGRDVRYGNGIAYTRISTANAWIDSIVPEPSGRSLLAVLAIAILGWGRCLTRKCAT